MLRRNGPVSVVSPKAGRESMMWKNCESGRSWAGSERVMELWMVRVVRWQSQTLWKDREQASQRQRDWNDADGEKLGVDSRDKARHIEKSDQLYVTRMMLVVEQEWREMKSECCEEVEQRWGYADMEVGWLWGLYSMYSVILFWTSELTRA